MSMNDRLNEVEKLLNILWEETVQLKRAHPKVFPEHVAVIPAGFEHMLAEPSKFAKEITASPARIEALQDQLYKVRDELTRKEGKYREDLDYQATRTRKIIALEDRNQQLDIEITELRGKLDRMSKIESGNNLCSECRKPCRPGQLMCVPCKARVLDEEAKPDDEKESLCMICDAPVGVDDTFCSHCSERADVTLEQDEAPERSIHTICHLCGGETALGRTRCMVCEIKRGPR